jgi:hypothetical protein
MKKGIIMAVHESKHSHVSWNMWQVSCFGLHIQWICKWDFTIKQKMTRINPVPEMRARLWLARKTFFGLVKN